MTRDREPSSRAERRARELADGVVQLIGRTAAGGQSPWTAMVYIEGYDPLVDLPEQVGAEVDGANVGTRMQLHVERSAQAGRHIVKVLEAAGHDDGEAERLVSLQQWPAIAIVRTGEDLADAIALRFRFGPAELDATKVSYAPRLCAVPVSPRGWNASAVTRELRRLKSP